MFMSRVRILAALIAAASANAPAVAQDNAPAAAEENNAVDDAVAFAEALTASATAVLTDASTSESEKLENFRAVLADGMALDLIGKFMIGEARKTMSDGQTARYEEIFPQYITKLYAEQFQEIVGKPLKVIEAKAIGARDVIVRTQFDRKDGEPIMVDWRIRQLRSGDRKAIDIIVSGVSIMLVKREEFSAFVAANGIDALLERLAAEAAA